LGIALPAAYGIQSYTILVSGYEMPTDMEFFLHDKLNSSYTAITKGTVYPLTVDPSNPLSIGEDRLEIIAAKKQTVVPMPVDFAVTVSATANSFTVRYEDVRANDIHIRLLDAAGQVLQKKYIGNQQQGQVQLPTAQLPQGLYLVEVQMGDNKIVKKVTKQ
jgi:hypothetical protein